MSTIATILAGIVCLLAPFVLMMKLIQRKERKRQFRTIERLLGERKQELEELHARLDRSLGELAPKPVEVTASWDALALVGLNQLLQLFEANSRGFSPELWKSFGFLGETDDEDDEKELQHLRGSEWKLENVNFLFRACHRGPPDDTVFAPFLALPKAALQGPLSCEWTLAV